jgi:hypothetical protein
MGALLLYVADNRFGQHPGQVHRVDDIKAGGGSAVGAAVISSAAGLRHRRIRLLLKEMTHNGSPQGKRDEK